MIKAYLGEQATELQEAGASEARAADGRSGRDVDRRRRAAAPTQRSTGIEIVAMSAGYGGVAVVRDLDLHVRPGEVVALLGPNGAGKTTTLLTISGLIKPLAARSRSTGDDVDTRSPYKNARLGLAHVAEDRSLFFQLTVEENLKLGLRGRGRQTGRSTTRSRCCRRSSR